MLSNRNNSISARSSFRNLTISHGRNLKTVKITPSKYKICGSDKMKHSLHYNNTFGMLSNVNIYWRDYHMQTALIVLLIIVCISLIAVVLLQSGKSAGLSGAISGGAEQLFGKQKARGMDLVLHRATVILSVLFFLIMLLLTYVS